MKPKFYDIITYSCLPKHPVFSIMYNRSYEETIKMIVGLTERGVFFSVHPHKK